MSAFECNRCGACCRLVGFVAAFAHLDRGDGACKHLVPHEDGSHSCAVYEDRPRFCRVDESATPALKLAEWQRRNHEQCERLRLAVYGGG